MGTGYRLWRRLLESQVDTRPADVALLALVASVTGVGAYLAARPDQVGRLVTGGGELLAVAVAALAFRRRFPLTVLGVTLSAAAIYYILNFPLGPEPIPFLITLHYVASTGRRAVTLGAAAATLGVIELSEVIKGSALEGPDLVPVVTSLAVVIAFGSFSGSRRAYLREVEQRALEAERTREAEARRRVAEERLRIARELHDSLGHHLTVVTMHAGAALMRRSAGPELAYQALTTVKAASQEALRELRGTLQVLRGDDPDGEAPLGHSAPTLAQLDDLVRRTEAAGPVVTTLVQGEQRPLPARVEQAAFRIVQEALTNVSRHAAAQTVRLRVRYEPDRLVLQIDDDGRGSAAPARPDGTGLLGMRERAAAVGGRLLAGPRAGGGFRVYAQLPVEAAA